MILVVPNFKGFRMTSSPTNGSEHSAREEDTLCEVPVVAGDARGLHGHAGLYSVLHSLFVASHLPGQQWLGEEAEVLWMSSEGLLFELVANVIKSIIYLQYHKKKNEHDCFTPQGHIEEWFGTQN